MVKFLPGVAAVGAGCMLSGCGLYQVYDEAKHYRVELAEQSKKAFDECMAGQNTTMTQSRKGAPPDCFDLVVKQSPKRVHFRKPAEDLRDGDRQPASPSDGYAQIDQFALMALFSKMVYHRFQLQEHRSTATACIDNAELHPLNYLYAEGSTNGRWKRWSGDGKGCHAQDGLFMETYVYHPAADMSRFTKAVIVFRGTENYRSEASGDWLANLAATFGFRPRQYAAAAEQLDMMLPVLRKDGSPELEIFAAGHSLGGGLAQMAAYWSKDIKAAYAFNSSPVSGWTRIHRERRMTNSLEKMNGDPTIYRVSQRTEALQAPRRVSTAVNSERFGRSDHEFDFRIHEDLANNGRLGMLRERGEQHDIGLLACHMAARVVLAHQDTRTSAHFDYTPQMALQVLQQKDRIVTDSGQAQNVCTRENLTAVRKALCEKGPGPAAICMDAAATTAAAMR